MSPLGWLEPLLDRIARSSSNVVWPVIDVIMDDTFEYILRIKYKGAFTKGGFNWDLMVGAHRSPGISQLPVIFNLTD